MDFSTKNKINIGISACLIGQKVRYNGDGLRPALINDQFARYFHYVPFCPEVGIGMGVPRETIRLEKKDGHIRLRASKSGNDYTEQMLEYARQKVEELAGLPISGYLLKKDSPTCGMERVKIYDPNGIPDKSGAGLFANALMERFPLIPVEEEGRLNDIRLREWFIERVFAVRRLQNFLADTPTLGKLMQFHTVHKMQLMAHHPQKYRALGHSLAKTSKAELTAFLAEYADAFLEIMATPASVKKLTDVLYHLFGYFKRAISPAEKQEFVRLLEQYRKKMIPMVVPITMLRHYLQKYPQEWLQDQVFMDPFPEELLLRSHL